MRFTSIMLATTASVAASLLVTSVVEAAPVSFSPGADQLRSFDNIIASLIGMEERLVRVGQSFARGIFVPIASLGLLAVIIQGVFRGGDLSGLAEQLFWTGVFALLIEVGPELGKAVVVTFREVGQSVASAPVTPQSLFDKSLRLANEGFSKSWYRPDMWMITFVLGLMSIVLSALITAVVFLWESESRVVLAASTVMLGLGGATQTRSYAFNFFRYAMGAGLRLMVVELINAQTMQVLDAGIEATLREESSTLEIWYTLIGGYLCTLVLIIVCPVAISSIASGSISSGAGLLAKVIPLSVGAGALGKMIAGAAGGGKALAVGAGQGQSAGAAANLAASSAAHEEAGARKRSDEGGPVPVESNARAGGQSAVAKSDPGRAGAWAAGPAATSSGASVASAAPASRRPASRTQGAPNDSSRSAGQKAPTAQSPKSGDGQRAAGATAAPSGRDTGYASVANMPVQADGSDHRVDGSSSFAAKSEEARESGLDAADLGEPSHVVPGAAFAAQEHAAQHEEDAGRAESPHNGPDVGGIDGSGPKAVPEHAAGAAPVSTDAGKHTEERGPLGDAVARAAQDTHVDGISAPERAEPRQAPDRDALEPTAGARGTQDEVYEERHQRNVRAEPSRRRPARARARSLEVVAEDEGNEPARPEKRSDG